LHDELSLRKRGISRDNDCSIELRCDEGRAVFEISATSARHCRGAGRPCLGNQTWLVMLADAMRLGRMSAAATAARRFEGLDLLRMLTLEGFHLLRVPLL
jgi:hypothetical protein